MFSSNALNGQELDTLSRIFANATRADEFMDRAVLFRQVSFRWIICRAVGMLMSSNM
jgi:hypothetical protein